MPALVDTLRRVEIRDIKAVTIDSVMPSPFASALLFAWVLVLEQVPQTLIELLLGVSESKWVLLAIVVMFFLVIGCIMEATIVFLVVAPMVLPALRAVGVNDVHFGIGLSMHRGTWQADDVELREQGVVRIYDVFFDYQVLLDTDAFFRELIAGPEFQRTMSTAEFHFLCGKYVRAREEKLGLEGRSLLAAAWECGVPIYTSSPGDSSIGMNIAAKALEGNQLLLDVNADVNETAAIVWDAKASSIPMRWSANRTFSPTSDSV